MPSSGPYRRNVYLILNGISHIFTAQSKVEAPVLACSPGGLAVVWLPSPTSPQAATRQIPPVWVRRPVCCVDVETPRLMFNYSVVQLSEDPAELQECFFFYHVSTNHTFSVLVTEVSRGVPRFCGTLQTCVFSCAGARRPSWMNEWVGPDINVVGPLQIPPSDEFSIAESAHLFGKSTRPKVAHIKTLNANIGLQI